MHAHKTKFLAPSGGSTNICTIDVRREYDFPLQYISGADGLIGDMVYTVEGKAGGQTSRHQKGKDDSEHSSKAALPLLRNPHLTECLLVKGLKPSVYRGPASWVPEQGGWGRRVEETLVVLLGEAHWLKPPTLARHHSNHLHELFYDRRSWWGIGNQ